MIIVAVIILNGMGRAKKREEAHEKVIELIKEGHDAEVCPKCKGKGCSKCGDMGYTYKLNKEKLREKDEKK